MADQDFFFEEENDTKPVKPAKSGAKAETKSSGAKSGSKAASPVKPVTVRPGASSAVASQSVTLAVAGLMAVCALLVGIIIGLVIPRSGADAGLSTTGAPSGAAGQVVPAPSLSSDQLKDGKLPPGHPSIQQGQDAQSGAKTDSKSTTATK